MSKRYTYNQSKAKPVMNVEGREVAPPTPAEFNLNFIMRNKLPLWALQTNTQPGLQIFRVKSLLGPEPFVLKPRNSLYPKEVTAQFDHETLQKGGQDLLRSFAQKNMALVWPSDALQMNGESGVTEYASPYAEDAGTNNKADAINAALANAGRVQGLSENGLNATASNTQMIHPRWRTEVLKFVNGESNFTEAQEACEILLPTVVKRDIEWAVAEVAEGKFRDYLKSLLAGAVESLPEDQKLGRRKKVAAKGSGQAPEDFPKDLTPEEKMAEARAMAAAAQGPKMF